MNQNFLYHFVSIIFSWKFRLLRNVNLINEKKFLRSPFYWQEGYGAFSYAKSQLDSVVKYILNQPEHHKKKTFRQEYVEFLERFEIEYDEKYLFEFYD